MPFSLTICARVTDHVARVMQNVCIDESVCTCIQYPFSGRSEERVMTISRLRIARAHTSRMIVNLVNVNAWPIDAATLSCNTLAAVEKLHGDDSMVSFRGR